MKCFSLHSAIQQKITDGIGHTSGENKYGAKKLTLIRAQNMVQNKIHASIKNVKALSSFMHAFKVLCYHQSEKI